MSRNSENDIQRLSREYQALDVLRVLTTVTSESAIDSVLYDLLAFMNPSDDRRQFRLVLESLVKSELLIGREQGEYFVVTLTERGERVANGLAVAEGVARRRL